MNNACQKLRCFYHCRFYHMARKFADEGEQYRIVSISNWGTCQPQVRDIPCDVFLTEHNITAHRYTCSPNSYLIGAKSVCQEKGCTPQFVRCVFCESYRPDPRFIPEAEQCCELLRQRVEHCRITGNDENLQFNEWQLGAYVEFIRRAEEGREVDEWPADL